MGGGSSKKHPIAGPDQEFLAAEKRRKAGSVKDVLKNHFQELQRLDPRVPRDEQALEVVLREFQSASEESGEALKEAEYGAAEAHTLAKEVSEKLCPMMLKISKDMQKQLEDAYFASTAEGKVISQKVDRIKQDFFPRCASLVTTLEPLVAKQRDVVGLMSTAHHKQQLGANAAVQALMNPMVGLNPAKYKAYPEKGIRQGRTTGPSMKCHMECAKVQPPVEWPFKDDPEQQANAMKHGTFHHDPAKGRLPILDPQNQAMVKAMLGRHFL